MKLTPTSIQGSDKKEEPRPSIRTVGGVVMDADGAMLGKEVDLASFERTAQELFTGDPEQKAVSYTHLTLPTICSV